MKCYKYNPSVAWPDLLLSIQPWMAHIKVPGRYKKKDNFFCYIFSQLRSKLKAVCAEMEDYREEQGRVREELALTLEELQRNLKLRFVLL